MFALIATYFYLLFLLRFLLFIIFSEHFCIKDLCCKNHLDLAKLHIKYINKNMHYNFDQRGPMIII